MKEDILEALSHLRIALVQVDPSDDQIIVQHMRDAVTALERIAGPAHDKSKQIALAGADMALLLQREQSELGHGYTTNLSDYRFAYLEGGCDCTGWDCQSSCSAQVAATYEEIVRFGCSESARTRFNIEIDGEGVRHPAKETA